MTLVEIDPKLAALADENVRLNGLRRPRAGGALDAAAPARAFAAAGLRPEVGRASADESAVQRSRAAARLARPRPPACPCGAARDASAWTRTAARLLRPRGTLSLIWRADGLGDVLDGARARLRRGHGAADPCQARGGRDSGAGAGRKGEPGAAGTAAGLVLNDASGRTTPDADAILRAGEALPLAKI